MKVYVVTAGDYSDYHIEKVFLYREAARLYAMMDADRDVEEYEVDGDETVSAMPYVVVRYNFRNNCIREMELCMKPEVPHVQDDWYFDFIFTLSLSNKKLYNSIMRYGKASGMVKKIATDKFAEYLYEHGTNREELIRKREERYASNRYPMYTTSIHTDAVGEYLTEFLNKHVAENIPLPSLPELQCMAEQKRKELEFKKYESI